MKELILLYQGIIYHGYVDNTLTVHFCKLLNKHLGLISAQTKGLEI